MEPHEGGKERQNKMSKTLETLNEQKEKAVFFAADEAAHEREIDAIVEKALWVEAVAYEDQREEGAGEDYEPLTD